MSPRTSSSMAAGDLFGVIARMAHVAAQEDLALLLAVLDRAQPFAHAVLGDHGPGDAGGLLDVVGRAGGGIVEDEFLGSSTTQHVGQLVEHLGAALGVLLLVGQHHGVAQGSPARQDRDLVDRVVARQGRGHDGVSAFVVGRDLALFLVHDTGALLGARDHAVDRLVEGCVGDEAVAVACGQQSGLVQDVGQVGTGEPG